MRKLKFFLAVVFLGIFGLLAVENRALFGQWYAFDFNFFIYEYRTPKVIVGVYFIAIFLIGFLIAYFSGLMDQYRFRRIIRKLEKELAAREDRASERKYDYKSERKTDTSDKTLRDVEPVAVSGASKAGPSA